MSRRAFEIKEGMRSLAGFGRCLFVAACAATIMCAGAPVFAQSPAMQVKEAKVERHERQKTSLIFTVLDKR